MHFFTAVTGLALAATAMAGSTLDTRGQSCNSGMGQGTCENTSDCTSQGFNVAGKCPGAANIQCCVKQTCSTSSGSGTCLNVADGCSSGSFVAGACPGDSSIKCCVKGGSSPPPPTSGGGSGSAVVSSAETQLGLPYVWGGGGCKGPSGGGFDCSGLTQYSICQTQNGKTIPRTADTQYRSDMGKHLPRAQAQAGDMLFWATGGNCGSSGNIKHVGIFKSAGRMVNAAKTGTPVREQAIWEASGDLAICPDAVRFW